MIKGTLTLARRYVYSNNDTRLITPLHQVAKGMCEHQLLRPWENLPLKDNTNINTNKKRKKSDS